MHLIYLFYFLASALSKLIIRRQLDSTTAEIFMIAYLSKWNDDLQSEYVPIVYILYMNY